MLLLQLSEDHVALILASICRIFEHTIVPREESTPVDIRWLDRFIIIIRLLRQFILIVFIVTPF